MIVRPLNHTGVLKRTKILILVKSIHVKDVAKHPKEFTVESVYVRLYLMTAFSLAPLSRHEQPCTYTDSTVNSSRLLMSASWSKRKGRHEVRSPITIQTPL